MRAWLLRSRDSFWLLPTAFGVAAVLLALLLVEVDRRTVGEGPASTWLLEDLSATGGRAILSAIGGTMLGVAATSFSITISVLATTSSAYGPRLVRNFMADRGNQLVLAVLTSTFLYTLIVLRSVHTSEESGYTFVPVLAISAAVLLAIADVAVLVYFIHHIATSVQVTTLQDRVLTELESVIDALYPEEGADPSGPARVPGSVLASVHATGRGYVDSVDLGALASAACRQDVVVRLRAHPGDHVVVGDPLVDLLSDDVRDADLPALERSVRSAVRLGTARTPHQDLRFAVQQLIEIGVRGLASGTNDPYTAVGALDALSGALVTLLDRPGPRSTWEDAAGTTRVVCDWPRPEELVADTYLAVRTYGMDQPLVLRAALRLSERLEAVAHGSARELLAEEVGALASAYARTDAHETERSTTAPALADLRERLGVPRRDVSAVGGPDR